jgi:CO/xanthine dehydrogenase FAD-binding subunit
MLISEVTIPLPQSGERVAFEKVSRTPADLPIVCVAARARIEDGVGRDVRIAVGGVGAGPMRVEDIEQTLEGRVWDASSIPRSAFDSIDAVANFMGSAEYRREMAVVLLRRALKQLSGL